MQNANLLHLKTFTVHRVPFTVYRLPFVDNSRRYADGGCALGPCLLLTDEPLSPSTHVALRIAGGGSEVFRGSAQLSQMKRTPEELVEFLYRECSFPNGCYLLTGTGIVPEAGFTLASGDEVEITIEPIGTLINRVR